MAAPLGPHAAAAAEALRALERALAGSRSQWNDATRQSFDERHVEPILVSSRKVASDLAALASELNSALKDIIIG